MVVEAFCNMFKEACTSAEIGGIGILDEAPPCSSFRGCWELFDSHLQEIVGGTGVDPKDEAIVGVVMRRPLVFLPILRAAQHLAAPPCAPPGWALELDKDY